MNINLQGEIFDTVKKHHMTSHGLSMVIMCMLESKHDGLKIETNYRNKVLIKEAYEQAYEAISRKTKIRSCQLNGNFLDEYKGKKLTKNVGMPSKQEFDNNKQILVDLDIGDSITITFYFYTDIKGRVLVIN